jgi:peptidoglycan/LPS O-acetylase OafA/YrhL
MSTALSKYPYVLAILYGILAFFIPATEPLPIFLSLFFLFLLGGGLFGFLWPRESWRWGLWIAGPMVGFLGLSVLFAGKLEEFFNKDLLLLLLVVASPCLGSFISARFKRRPRVNR